MCVRSGVLRVSRWLFLLPWLVIASRASAADVPDYAQTNIEPQILIVLDASVAMKLCATLGADNTGDGEPDPLYSCDDGFQTGGAEPCCTETSLSSINSNEMRYAVAVKSLKDLVSSYGDAVKWGLVITSHMQKPVKAIDPPGPPFFRNSCLSSCSAALCISQQLGDSCYFNEPGKVKVQLGASTMLTELDNYYNLMYGLNEVSVPAWIKDWEEALTDSSPDSTNDSAYEEWVRAIANDSNAACRKRAQVFVTSGGGTINDNYIADSAARIESIYNYGDSYGDAIETYVMGFKVIPSEADYARLLAMAQEGDPQNLDAIPFNANTYGDYTAILTSLVSGVLAGEYSGSNPILSWDNENLYQAYFKIYDDPELRAYEGHMLGWNLESDGDIPSDPEWDVATWLGLTTIINGINFENRLIYTSYDNGTDPYARTDFSSADLVNFEAGLAVEMSDVNCDAVTGSSGGSAELTEDATALVNFVRGDTSQKYATCGTSAETNREPYKLLDIWRSTARYIGPTRALTSDADYACFQTFQKWRDESLIVGSNSGMIHSFQTAHFDLDGERVKAVQSFERWAFIPAHLLPKLQDLWENGHSLGVDATGATSDVEVGEPAATERSDWKWRTIYMSGDGIKGDEGQCFTALTSDPVDEEHLFYCGWYNSIEVSALSEDFDCDDAPPDADAPPTYTVEPLFEFMGDGDIIEAVAPPAIGLVRLAPDDLTDEELDVAGQGPAVLRWVAFLGGKGTYSLAMNNSAACHAPFYAIDPGIGRQLGKLLLPYVIDSGCNGDDRHGIWAQPVLVDTQNDLLADRIYLGDVDGQLWVIDMESDDGTVPSSSDWTANRAFYPDTAFFGDTTDHLFTYTDTGSTVALPFAYNAGAVYLDTGEILILIGNGSPLTIDEYSSGAHGNLYALIDDLSGDDLQLFVDFNAEEDEVNGGVPTPGYLKFEAGEVIAGAPVIQAGTTFFTTYILGDGCILGEGRLYAIDYRSGKSVLPDANADGSPDAFMELGTGIPSAPVIGRDRIYVTMNDGDYDNGSALALDVGDLTQVTPTMPYNWIEVTGR